MEVIRNLGDLPPLKSSVVTVGNFDGVHVGHQQVLASAVKRANEIGSRAIALTFVPHPVRVVAPGREPARLTPIEQKLVLMGRSGLDLTVVLHFDRRLATMPPARFAREVLHESTDAKTIIVGTDFRYGRGRGGDIEQLEQAGLQLGFDVEPVEPVVLEGAPVSSSRIRACLVEGQVELAARLLGRPHQVAGVVVRGDQRGRTIGFPTANLGGLRALLPGTGVYACWAHVDDECRMAAVNIGDRRTFGRGRSVEAYLLDFDGDLYGREISLSYVSWLRSDLEFPGVAELVEQIEIDVQQTRQILEASEPPTPPQGSRESGVAPPGEQSVDNHRRSPRKT